MCPACHQYRLAEVGQPSSADVQDVLARALDLAQAGESFVLATVVWRQGPSSGQHGSRALVTEEGILHGWIGGACAEPVLLREAKRVLAEGEARLVWLGQAEEFERMQVPQGVVTVPIACQSDGALQVFIEPFLAAPRVVVVGRSPLAHTLTAMIVNLGWQAELVDGDAVADVIVTPATTVVVATQGHGDEDVIETVLRSNPVLVGLVASRKRGEAVRAYLRDRGFSDAQLASLQVPFGIDLGHTSHREIAVSILAELVARRAGGQLRPLTRSLLPMVEVATAIDPVCGMTVDQVDANRPLEHSGSVYYFCAPGCRAAFAKDPETFLNAGATQQEASC